MNLPSTPKQPPRRNRGVHHEALRVRKRPDLVAVETKHQHESAMVVKDPISLKYHRLRPDEFFVLDLLDGSRTLDDIREAYEQRYQPLRVSMAQLNQLLFRFHQNGLTLSDSTEQGDRLNERRQKERREKWMQYISGVLFIRFPGVDPEPLLRRIYPLMRPLLSRLAIATAVLVCVAAVVVFAGKWQQFASEFPRMQDWLRVDAIFIFACVLGGTKVLHELGHAITCKHFGGECHQIGPMLLVFTPALYCDTSDSWMLTSRWQRAAVGFAGIATEVFLAAIATFIWASTGPGLVHYVAMNVMLVCSVSTLLFNANPLLRYDGYYVLSDLCDVPNMGEKARRLLSGYSANLFLGVDEHDPEAPEGPAAFWLFVYAISAFIYRWGLTLVILWFVSLMLRPYGLESIGRLLCLFAAGGLIYSIARNPIQFMRNPARRRLIQMKRLAISAVCLIALGLLASIPFSSGISATARIIPRSESPIYVSTAGKLAELNVQTGEYVKKGDQIAQLINHDVELQYVQARGRLDAQRDIVESIRRSQFDHPEAANELPAAKALLIELEKQLNTRKARRDGLAIVAPATGKLIVAPRRAKERLDSNRAETQLVSWSGYPTDSENEGCFLKSGTELMSVALSDDWDAEITLDQNQVERITLGNRVKLALNAQPSKTFFGTVTDISRTFYRPDENAPRRDDLNASQRATAPSKTYLVRVQLESTEQNMITGAAAISRITGKPISITGRIQRFLNGILRFR